MTYTRTRRKITFADPFKHCNYCGDRIDGVLVVDNAPDLVSPCGHSNGYTDECPSWSPVDGCCCAEQLGYVPHKP